LANEKALLSMDTEFEGVAIKSGGEKIDNIEVITGGEFDWIRNVNFNSLMDYGSKTIKTDNSYFCYEFLIFFLSASV
jgi:hypothetical protein